MGFGDQLMATGLARGANARGKRMAFGDGHRIIWDKSSETVFRGNPNIARPGDERAKDLEWSPFYKGHRIYNRQDGDRWIWNLDFRPIPGEMFFERGELRHAERVGSDFVLIEPNVERWKSSAANKDWGRHNYQRVADELRADGFSVFQFHHPTSPAPLNGVTLVKTMGFRDALAMLGRASLYLGAEGGLHHGAAAMGIPAVVLFGGFIPPSVTGYDGHANLTGGASACGSLKPCKHCAEAMAAIAIQDVYDAARERL